jgi:type IV pilus assembly protein PilE
MLTRTAQRRRRNGFTLIEVMVAAGVAAVIASLAYPSYTEQVRSGRRSDAIARLSEAQLAQEIWRANNRGYGTLAETGIAADTAAGLYRLSIPSVSADGYVAVAQAIGAQAADAPCRFMRISVSAGVASYASGPDASVGNAAGANQRCWKQ